MEYILLLIIIVLMIAFLLSRGNAKEKYEFDLIGYLDADLAANPCKLINSSSLSL